MQSIYALESYMLPSSVSTVYTFYAEGDIGEE